MQLIFRIIKSVKDYFKKYPDPVKCCEVYKLEGCGYVDGFLCHPNNCNILDEYRKQHSKDINIEAVFKQG